MKFAAPATTNPIDRGAVVGRPLERYEGRLKVTGTAHYACERHDVAPDAAHGFVVGAAIAKGRITALDTTQACAAAGVVAVVTAENAGPLHRAAKNTAPLLAGPDVVHYHQAVALVVAETFEQARAAAALVRVTYAPAEGRFDLAASRASAKKPEKITSGPADTRVGDFDSAFAAAPVTLDATYTTPDESHAMMEPHGSTAAWHDGKLLLWTSSQMVDWWTHDLARTLGIPKDHVHLQSPYVGGGFGGKLFLRADAVLAALGARAAGRPVKVSLQRALMFNNTTHRPATIQRIRIGATREGRMTALAHESWSGDLAGGRPDGAVHPTRLLYAADHRLTATRLSVLDLPEANAMRAPGEATGSMALEIAIDEMAGKLGIDPVEFRILNDTQIVPDHPGLPRELRFSQRELVQCLRVGAERFGWTGPNPRPGEAREGHWLVGRGVAAAYRGNELVASGARVTLERDGSVLVETDMTDIGTGSYTIIAQTAAEMLGLPVERVRVMLGDSAFPVSAGSGGQFGAMSSTAGVYAACLALRGMIAARLAVDPRTAVFEEERVRAGDRVVPLAAAADPQPLVAEDSIEFGDTEDKAQQSTFGAHFVEVAVHALTGEVRVRRMLAVCACGRILNPRTARSQVIGAMTMGVGAALMEALHVDTKRGFFVNHDLAGYEIPVHADIPHQDVIFIGDPDPMASPMKAKGVAELGICGVAAAIANAVHDATGIRVRDYPVTLDKLLHALPSAAAG